MSKKLTPSERQDSAASSFATLAKTSNHGVARELIGYMRRYRKWWLTPVVLAVLLLGFLVFLSGTAVAPLIYTLF